MDARQSGGESSSNSLKRGEPNTSKTNLIWDYFIKNKQTAECKTCHCILKTPTGTTTTLINHLSARHKKEYALYTNEQSKITDGQPKKKKFSEESKGTITSYLMPKWTASSKEAQSVTHKIAKFVVSGLHPYSIVEEDGFRDLIKDAYPRYTVPSRTTFSRNVVPSLFQSTKAELKRELLEDIGKNVQSFSLTTDFWSSRANESYASLTGHYVTCEFELKSKMLNCSYMSESHTAENIKVMLTSLFTEWEIPQTVPVYVVTDNAHNIRAAVNSMTWKSVSCFAHSLQLSIHDAESMTPGIENMCKKARKIVGHYSRSSTARYRLQQKQRQVGFESVLEVIQDVETRWNSKFIMLKRLLVLKEAIAAELASDPNCSIDSLSASEWKLIGGVVEVLEPIAQATEETSSERYPTLGLVIPLLQGMHYVLRNHIQQHKPGSVFAQNLCKSLKSRFPLVEQDKLYLMATAVDPRYKLEAMPEESKVLAKQFLQEELRKLRNTVKTLSEQDSQVMTPDENVKNTQTKTCTKSVWGWLESMPIKKKEVTADTEVEYHIEMFIIIPRIPRSANPLQWWKENSQLFPLLSEVAQHFLAIPATQVSSERVFSTGGNVVSSKREVLISSHVEELIFLHENLKKKSSAL